MASQVDSGNTPDGDEKSPFKAYVGIDFGTDGSGLAYGLPDGSAYIHNMWDDTPATQKPKTSVLFDGGGNTLRVGSEAQDLYLKTTNVGWKLFERFKMNLYEEPSSKSHLRNAQSKMEFVELKKNITTTNNENVTEDASKVFIEELKYLKKHSFKFIETHLRKKLNLTGDQQNGWPEIQYFLTVPAIWGDKAKDQMVKWAEKAGLISGKIENQLKIVYEPDCASLSIQHAILRNMKNKNNNNNNNNNNNDNDSFFLFTNKLVLPDIDEWLKANNLQKFTTQFKEENVTMDELLELGEDPTDLKEYLDSLEIPSSSIIRICSKIKKMIQQRKTNNDNNNNNNNDSMKLHPLKPQINIDVPLKEGDKYILCDIGGGTCDVACHEVMGDFQIAEVLHPSGGKWGATYIDERFIKLLGELFTTDLLDIFQMTEDDGVSSYLTFRAHFLNEAKLSFYSQQTMYHDIAMPAAFVTFICNQYNQKYNEGEDSLKIDTILDNLNNALSSLSLNDIINGNFQEKFNCKTDKNDNQKTAKNWIFKIKRTKKDEVGEDYVLSMHVSVWKMLFDTIIDPIIGHCQAILVRQEMKGTKYIFLVGGFANCKYFQLRMEKEFYNLDVVRPGLPGLCVVDGAARYAMDKRFVKIRRLARSYGTKNNLLAAGLELKNFPKGYVKYYDNERKAEYVEHCFNAFVKKNQPIRVGGKPITQTTYKKCKSQTSAAISILATEKDNVYLAKDCGKPLGQVIVPLPKGTDDGTVVEFRFDTKLTVFAYPKGKPNELQKHEVDYY